MGERAGASGASSTHEAGFRWREATTARPMPSAVVATTDVKSSSATTARATTTTAKPTPVATCRSIVRDTNDSLQSRVRKIWK